jgi:hypothetical protein
MRIKMISRLLVAGAVAAGVLVPALPAQAAYVTKQTPTLTCDGATRTVTASVEGTSNHPANTQLMVRATFISGAWDLADTSIQPRRGTIGYRPPVTTTVTTDATGAFSGPVFSIPFVGTGTVANYTEMWLIRVANPDNTGGWETYASCRYDTRTVARFDCDGDGHSSISVSGSGLNPALDPTVVVTYYRGVSFHKYFGEPGFTGHTLNPPLNADLRRQVTVTVNADGTWSDPGLQWENVDPRVEYSWGRYIIFVGRNYGIVGGAEDICVTVDRRT